MTNQTQSYSNAEIRNLLNRFDSTDLIAICQDNFPNLYSKVGLGRGLLKSEIINEIMDYFIHHGFLPLLTAVKERDRELYNDWKDTLYDNGKERKKKPLEEIINKARALLEENAFDEAIKLLGKARTNYPRDDTIEQLYLEALYGYGVRVYVQYYNLPLAMRLFQEVVDIDPSYKDAARLLDEVKGKRQKAFYIRAARWWGSLDVGRKAASVIGSVLLVFICLFGAVGQPAVTEWIVAALFTPTPTATATPTPTVKPTGPTIDPTKTVTFTITCATVEHIIQSKQPITISAVNAVIIEPNFIPKDWETLSGTLQKLPSEEKKFSYAPSGSGPDMVIFTFSVNEKTRSVMTKVLPITIVSERQGLCYSEND